MPIRPENRHRYPKDWPAIRQRILQRARWRCEHPGCGAAHHAEGYWRDGQFAPMSRALRDAGCKPGSTIQCDTGETLKILKIVLTIAHLDHTPENCADDNLRAWCQRHHLAYDAKHHQVTAYRTRKAAARTADLFAA
jgi:hypothetical protein